MQDRSGGAHEIDQQEVQSLVRAEFARLYYPLMGAVGQMIEQNNKTLREELREAGVLPEDEEE